MFLSLKKSSIKKGMSRGAITRMVLHKYSDTQARDYHGRWTAGGSDPTLATTKEALNAAALRNPEYTSALARNEARGDARNDPGVLDKNGYYTPEANAENVNIANSLLNPNSRVPFGEKPDAVIMLGKPGSGKSTLVDSLGYRDKYTVIDADAAMARLPGYEPDLAGAYHGRAGDIADNTMLTEAANQNMNIVYDTTGRSASKILDIADNLHELGYNIHVVHASISDLDAGKRAYSRWANGGRLVPIDFVTSKFGDRPARTFQLMKDYYAKNAREYDTSTRAVREITKSLFRNRGYLRKSGRPSVVHAQKIGGRKKVRKYSEEQARDYHGRWTSGGGGSSKVIFEVAPNPDDKGKMDRWNSLSDKEKADRSEQVAREYIPKILDAEGIKGGEVRTQIGSYENDTNSSFSLVLPAGTDPTAVVTATQALGYNLDQKGMMTLGAEPFPGSSPVDAIEIENSKDFDLLSAKDVYDGLRSIQVDGKPVINGQTTIGNRMSILNFPEEGKSEPTIETGRLKELVVAQLDKMGGDYKIHVSTGYSWMASKEKDYGSYSGRSSGRQGTLEGQHISETNNTFRDAIAQVVTKAFREIFGKYKFIPNPGLREEIIGKALVKGPYPLISFSEFSFIPDRVQASPHSFGTRMVLKNSSHGNEKFALTLNKVKSHPVAQSFRDLHKKYEPLVAKAFLGAARKIKSQINMKDLAEAVVHRNVHHVVQLVVGDKFKKYLEASLKPLLFEAYHAGALVGAGQLKNAPVKKGGPGSGPHPGFSRHGTASDMYNAILSRQRMAEGMRPAVRHLDTGEVHEGHSGEVHLDILERLEADNRDYEQGFVTRHGGFISRERAERTYGIHNVTLKALTGSLDVTNPEAVSYLENTIPDLILEISDEQAAAVQSILLNGVNSGLDGPAIARQIRDVVGLTEQQTQWVMNFRQQLITGEDGGFTPIEERRLSAIDQRLAQDEFDSPETDMGTIDLLVGNYADSLLNKRSMDISVTEIHNAFVQGQDDLWGQAVDQGYLDPALTRRHWLATDDDRVRDDHMAAQEMNEPDGVALDEPFQTPWGDADNPGDGPDNEAINCRCVVFLTFLEGEGDNTGEVDNTGEEDINAEA